MPNINIKKLIYHIRWRYLTLNNIVLAVALVIGANWAWGSIEMMQRNYTLQKSLDLKQREQKVVELQTDALAYQQKYYQSDEYQELAAREYAGLAAPGEKVLILPPNTAQADSTTMESSQTTSTIVTPATTSNVKQWINFLFGNNSRNLQKS